MLDAQQKLWAAREQTILIGAVAQVQLDQIPYWARLAVPDAAKVTGEVDPERRHVRVEVEVPAGSRPDRGRLAGLARSVGEDLFGPGWRLDVEARGGASWKWGTECQGTTRRAPRSLRQTRG